MPLNPRSRVAPDQQRNEAVQRQATTGFVFLLLVAGGLLFVVWLARQQFTREYAIYNVELAGPVQGLATGGGVAINGVRAGEVIRLALDPINPSKVIARIRVSADTPVRQDSTATLEWVGIGGSRIIQLSGGTLSKPLLRKVTPPNTIPVIHGAGGDGGGDSPKSENKSPAEEAVEALEVVDQLLSDENLEAIDDSLARARARTTTLRNRAKEVATADAQLLKATAAANDIAQSAESATLKVNGELRNQLRQLADDAANGKESIKNVRAKIAQTQLAAGGRLETLPALTSKIVEIGGIVNRAGELIDQLDSPEPQLLGRPASEELKVAP